MTTCAPDVINGPSSSTPIQTTESAYLGWKSLMSTKTSKTNNTWSCGPCDDCTDLLWLILVTSDTDTHRKDSYNPSTRSKGHRGNSFSDLSRSAKSCDLCAMIRKTVLSLPETDVHPTSINIGYSVDPKNSNGSGADGKGVRQLCVSNGVQSRYLGVFTKKDDPMAKTVSGRIVPERSGGLRQLLQAKEWLDECSEQHARCKSSPGDLSLPTRVIDIGDSTGTSCLRLIETNARSGRWAALSHRWGTTTWKDKVFGRKTSILTMISANKEQLQQNIDRSRLTSTFQDAIDVTRALGLRYLWIDSLCIIQDSAEDWERESMLMAQVYRHAHVTISAAVGPNGIFCERAWAKKASPVKYRIFTGSGIGTVMFDVEYISKMTGDSNTNYLESRAWCFQEARLSPRLLTFDQNQMSLTCLQGRQKEIMGILGNEKVKHRNNFLLEIGHSLHSEVSRETILEMWYNLVEDYSARNLTVASDKLVAMSSVARLINTKLDDVYMAGMWEKSPPQGLLWRPDKDYITFSQRMIPASKTQRPYTAPSWSWASVDGRVAFPFARWALEEKTIATVVYLHCESDGQDRYGKVHKGYLVISGPLKKATCGEPGFNKPSQISLYRRSTNARGTGEEEFAFCMLDTTPLEKGSVVWCFQISTAHGLVLTKTSSGTNEFMRLGIYTQNTEIRSAVENLEWWARGGNSTIKII